LKGWQLNPNGGATALFAFYVVALTGVLWYSLFYLPFLKMDGVFGFVLNILLYGCLSLLSFQTYRQEKQFRNIFFQFWILFSAMCLSGTVGLHFTFKGSYNSAIAAYVLMTILLHALVAWVVAKVLFQYIFHAEKGWRINLFSSLVVLPLCGWLFWPHWWQPNHILTLPTATSAATLYAPIQTCAIWVNGFSLLLFLAFFVHKYRTDRPIGAFADTMLFLFGLYVIVDTVEIVAQVKSLELMNITQWVFGLIAVGMMVTLGLRLKYKSQSIANYYESQFLSDDPRIGRRIGLFDRLILRSFFDPQAVGKRIFLGANGQKMTVRRTSPRVSRPVPKS
jgi:hypothetical protein